MTRLTTFLMWSVALLSATGLLVIFNDANGIGFVIGFGIAVAVSAYRRIKEGKRHEEM